MVLNHCTICSVYETADADQKRIPVKCAGEQILLLLKREQELSDTVNIRIDFFDSEIGCIKAHCAVVVRSNYDPSIPAPWVADCDILDVIEIVEARRSLIWRKKRYFHLQSRRNLEGLSRISARAVFTLSPGRSCSMTAYLSFPIAS